MDNGTDLLTRIKRVCEFYRGATWALAFDSSDGGFWSLKLLSPPEEGHQGEIHEHPLGFMVRTAPPDYPIFAMRCQELEVIAEAIEAWHSKVVMRDVK